MPNTGRAYAPKVGLLMLGPDFLRFGPEQVSSGLGAFKLALGQTLEGIINISFGIDACFFFPYNCREDHPKRKGRFFMKYTLKDIVKRANVSPATVSNLLTHEAVTGTQIIVGRDVMILQEEV